MEHKIRRFWMMKLDTGLITPLPASDSGSATVWGSKRIKSCLCLTCSGCPSNDDDNKTLTNWFATNWSYLYYNDNQYEEKVNTNVLKSFILKNFFIPDKY